MNRSASPVIGLLIAVTIVAAAGAQGSGGAAWLVRSLTNPSDTRESHPDVLDAPIMPGSVVKAVALVAALETHLIEPDSTHICRRVVTIDGVRYACSHPDLKRPLTPAEALAHSCNDFFVSLASRLSRTAVNDVRARIGLPPIAAGANFAAALVGLDGPRLSPRLLLDSYSRLIGIDRRHPVKIAESTRRVLLDGLRGAATYGSASELASRGIAALAKTGTAPMPGGGFLGVLVAFAPADSPRQAIIVVAPGAAGRDATSIAGDLLTGDTERVRVGTTDAAGRTRIDTLRLEDYVARVVSGEGQPNAPAAAQQALAIAARTFALANLGRHRGEGFDLCDTTHCQVLRAATPAATRAQAATDGLVLMHEHRPAPIFYSASCGGHSELPSQVWPGATDYPFLPAQKDDACRDDAGWTSEIPAPEIERALRSAGLKGDGLRNLTVIARSASGRVTRLRADGFVPAELPGEDFRLAIGRTAGWQLLKSAAFEMRRSSRGYLFNGHGSGHGVGMCVVGAGCRAASGATAEAILQFYYPGLRIEPYRANAGVPAAPADALLALPAAEERERELVMGILRRAREQISVRTGVTGPAAIRVTVHPSIESFSRATGQPWWTSAATRGTNIDLLPVSVLRRQGQLERTIRHEMTHVLLDESLARRPMWVREGAALYFVDPSPSTRTAGRQACPADAEFVRPMSADAQRDTYVRAESCFRRQIESGRSWRDVR